MNRCEFCGKEFIKKEIEILGMKKSLKLHNVIVLKSMSKRKKLKKYQICVRLKWKRYLIIQ